MKKHILLAMATAFCFSTASMAQEAGTSEVNVSVGVGTSTEISDLFTDILAEEFSGGDYSIGGTEIGPTFGLTYRYAVADRWMISGDLFYQKKYQDLYLSGNKNAEVRYSYVTVGVGTDYRYISTSIFQMYSGLAVAYTRENIKYSNLDYAADGNGLFNYQVTAVGFRVGESYAAFAELGFGYKGIANAGISYQF